MEDMITSITTPLLLFDQQQEDFDTLLRLPVWDDDKEELESSLLFDPTSPTQLLPLPLPLVSTTTCQSTKRHKTKITKQCYKKKTTTNKKIKLVFKPSKQEKAAAVTGHAKRDLQVWYYRLNQLAHYKAVHGHTNVPQKYPDNPQLGIWVNKQRMEKKFMDDGTRQSSMTEERMNALERLGFAWAKQKGDFVWNERFKELQEFKVQHGHANVPTKYYANKALGRWVSTQRSQAKLFLQGQQCHMTQEHFDRLVSIGFDFDRSKKKSPSANSKGRLNYDE